MEQFSVVAIERKLPNRRKTDAKMIVCVYGVGGGGRGLRNVPDPARLAPPVLGEGELSILAHTRVLKSRGWGGGAR